MALLVVNLFTVVVKPYSGWIITAQIFIFDLTLIGLGVLIVIVDQEIESPFLSSFSTLAYMFTGCAVVNMILTIVNLVFKLNKRCRNRTIK